MSTVVENGIWSGWGIDTTRGIGIEAICQAFWRPSRPYREPQIPTSHAISVTGSCRLEFHRLLAFLHKARSWLRQIKKSCWRNHFWQLNSFQYRNLKNASIIIILVWTKKFHAITMSDNIHIYSYIGVRVHRSLIDYEKKSHFFDKSE